MRRPISVSLLAACAASVVVFICSDSMLPPLADWLDTSDPRLPATCVLALPGGNNTRTLAAAALVNARLCRKAILIQNEAAPDVSDGDALASHEVARRVLEKRGVPPDKIRVLRGVSGSTQSDAKIASQIWNEDPDTTLLVVTNSHHVRRAEMAFKTQLSEERFARVSFVGAPEDRYAVDSWWQTEAGLQMVTSEYLKLAFYAARQTNKLHMVTLITVAIVLAFVRHRWRILQSRNHSCELAA